MSKIITLDEKIELLSGVNTWSSKNIDSFIKEIRTSDGPHGVRYVYKEENWNQYSLDNNAYPSLSCLANSWSKETIKDVGKAIASDCIDKDVDVILAPGVNIKRTPLCGRNFEYFSEDPLLSGELGRIYIEGVQSLGIGTSLKHYCLNNREYDRFFQSSNVDERTFREIYLKPFEIALQAHPLTVMCSYNPINGIYASENRYLLKEILKEEFNFNGVVVSDWGAVRNRAISLKAGIDLAMPFDNRFKDQIKEALDKNYLTEDDINESVERLLAIRKRIDEAKPLRKNIFDNDERINIALKAAEESMVLLKNDNILPLNNVKETIGVIGSYAISPLVGGEGSSKVKPTYKDTSLVEKLQKRLPNSTILYEDGYIVRYNLLQPNGYKNAIKLAYNCDKVILCIGTSELDEKEETDKLNIALKPQIQDLINKICEVNSNVILCVYSGGPVELTAFKDKVKAIIYVGLAGECVNDALAHILVGKVNPSGKLSETFPLKLEDTITSYNVGNSFYEDYSEGIFVGYRHYDKHNIDVLFPFGFGLSYSNFEYSNLRITKINETKYDISYDIENTSNIDGKEVSQLYISNNFRMVPTAKKDLVRFSKDLIKAHNKVTINFTLEEKDFSYFSANLHDYYCENGTYEILVGSSSRNIKLKAKINIQKDKFSQYSQR